MILHELIPFFWLPSKDKTKNEFLITSGCLLFRKVWWAVRIGSFFPKLRIFTDQNGPKMESYEYEF